MAGESAKRVEIGWRVVGEDNTGMLVVLKCEMEYNKAWRVFWRRSAQGFFRTFRKGITGQSSRTKIRTLDSPYTNESTTC
jgi:hypothetical protein